MKLFFVADGRSPISRSWIVYWIRRGDEVHLASTFACDPIAGLASFAVVPVAFSGRAAPAGSAQPRRDSRFLHLRNEIRHWLGPLTIPRAGERLRGLVERVQPDLVHALRIPYEGMLAANASLRVPLVISVWGNDFTLHGPSTPLMRQHTQWAMSVADALHADCQRDIRLAREWGLRADAPTLVTPGSGGIDMDVFHPPAQLSEAPVIFNPRGFRAYVRNDTFFQSVPLVLKEFPNAKFVCASMAGQPEALEWIRDLGIERSVELLEPRPQTAMAEVYREAMVLASPSTHDGTPNTLLEGMACGCFPIVGDLESLREWIRDGENGLLVDPASPSALAAAVIAAIKKKDLRAKAAGLNRELIASRAEYGRNMARVEQFYSRVIELGRG
jgi:glycosyltransferase involved in cell wall biosynthesis